MANPGKRFETNWRNATESQDLFIIRMPDTDLSFNLDKQKNTKFTSHSKCDFIQYYKGILLPLELKSTASKSLSFERRDNQGGMLKLHQIGSLVNMSQFEGVLPGLIINFRTEDEEKNILDEDTYFIDISSFSQFMYDSDKNSINKINLVDYGAIIVKTKKLRKYFTYDVKDLLEKIVKQYKL